MIIGIDTSNYTTSVAAASGGEIISDRRRLLEVRDGERGLRQQEAVFQHISYLPALYRELVQDIGSAAIDGVACSVRPRPVEGSYMPVFMAGKAFAEVIAGTLGVPLYEFSHQEGHAEAAAKDTLLEGESSYVFFHLSGGTTEAVSLPEYVHAGGTLDISFGQLIDRAGVAMGMKFPCGREMDELALSVKDMDTDTEIKLPRIKVRSGEVNLSGIESACQRLIHSGRAPGKDLLSRALFDCIAEALWDMTLSISGETGQDSFLFAGGVSSSIYIRGKLEEFNEKCGGCFLLGFGKPELCRDNAAGIALLGEKESIRNGA